MSTHSRSLEIESAAAKILLTMIAETVGDDQEMIADAIEGQTGLMEAMDRAVDRIAALEANAAALKEQVHALTERRQRFEVGALKLRDMIKQILADTNLQKVERPRATLSLRKVPPSVIITDATTLPETYLRHKAPEPDKTAIGKALKSGQFVPGAMLSNGSIGLSVSFS